MAAVVVVVAAVATSSNIDLFSIDHLKYAETIELQVQLDQQDKWGSELNTLDFQYLVNRTSWLKSQHISVWMRFLCDLYSNVRAVSTDLHRGFEKDSILSKKTAKSFALTISTCCENNINVLIPVNVHNMHWFLIEIHSDEGNVLP